MRTGAAGTPRWFCWRCCSAHHMLIRRQEVQPGAPTTRPAGCLHGHHRPLQCSMHAFASIRVQRHSKSYLARARSAPHENQLMMVSPARKSSGATGPRCWPLSASVTDCLHWYHHHDGARIAHRCCGMHTPGAVDGQARSGAPCRRVRRHHHRDGRSKGAKPAGRDRAPRRPQPSAPPTKAAPPIATTMPPAEM